MSTNGVLPDPPTEMFPTLMTGHCSRRARRISRSNSRLRSATMDPYIQPAIIGDWRSRRPTQEYRAEAREPIGGFSGCFHGHPRPRATLLIRAELLLAVFAAAEARRRSLDWRSLL